jgi:hypothetical protein
VLDLPDTYGELRGGADRCDELVADGKSGARLERLSWQGHDLVAKHLDRRADWTMRSLGYLECIPSVLWHRGVLADLPPCILEPTVAVYDDDRWPPDHTVVVMWDVSDWLVPDGDEPISRDAHEAFMDHMAAMHARFWEPGEDCEVIPLGNRYLWFSPWLVRTERALSEDPPLVPRLAGEGWDELGRLRPDLAAWLLPLTEDPSPLVAALEDGPQTFIHGNWKLANLGRHPDGRTVLFDWEDPGIAPPTADLAWYLALNSARLPTSKESTIASYRAALERHGVPTTGWFDRQLQLALLGAVVQFGWEKALGGDGAELAWWTDRAAEGRALLG